MDPDGRVALVLGAAGGIGSETALALARRGWTVRALHRGEVALAITDDPCLTGRIAWVRGDAMWRDCVVEAARGACVLVHAVNPPGYRLLDRDDVIPTFARFHMGTHHDPGGAAMVDAIREVVGDPEVGGSGFPWWALTLASPFVPMFREVKEMRYLWEVPLQLDGTRLRHLLGDDLPHTPLNEVVGAALRGLGGVEGSGGPRSTIPRTTVS